MLANIKNDLLYLLNILESIEKIFIYFNNCNDAEEFYNLNEQLNFNAVLNLLSNIGENVRKISQEIKDTYKKTEWQKIKNCRNRITYNYVNIDIFIVFEIIKNDLNFFKTQIMIIISNELENKNFDMKEFDSAKESFYYRHINFEQIEKL